METLILTPSESRRTGEFAQNFERECEPSPWQSFRVSHFALDRRSMFWELWQRVRRTSPGGHMSPSLVQWGGFAAGTALVLTSLHAPAGAVCFQLTVNRFNLGL